jgi:hypothetical protein
VSLSYDACSVFSLFSKKYKGSRLLNLKKPCGPCEDVGVSSCRCRQGAYQVHMYVVKSAGGNGYWFDSCRQLCFDRPSLTVLAVLHPGCHVCCHAFPGELAGYQAASRPNTRVGHLVHGGKNLKPVAGGHNQSGPPLRDVTKEEHAGNPSWNDVKRG